MNVRALAVSVLSFGICTSAAAASIRPVSSALGDSASDVVYTTLPQPCRIIDTRLAGGPLTEARDFKVAGSDSLATQGGNASGCGIPAGPATAVMINFVAVNPAGQGNLRGSAYGTAIPVTGSIINYQAVSPTLNVANGVVFPICDPATSFSCDEGFDITVQPNGASTDLVADVIGYFSKYQFPSTELAYTTLPQPCRIIDTRSGGGSLTPGVARNFKVTGTTGFTEQGGNASGCGVPSGAKVAMINFVAVNAQGAGNLRGSAYPNPVPSTGSVINYQLLNPALNIANGLLFPICDPGTAKCDFDITLQPNASGVDVVADVLGYLSTAGLHQNNEATQQNLTYTRFAQPCRIIDTRSGGGILAPGISRNFKVAGGSGFTGQGGTELGCGVPTDATAAMINFVAVGAQGVGNLRGAAFPNAIPSTGSVINYQLLSPALNIANGLMFPICDAAISTCTSDITLQANNAGTHVVADVMGYAKRTLPIENRVELTPAIVTVDPDERVTFTLTTAPQGGATTFALTVTPADAGTIDCCAMIPGGQTSTVFDYRHSLMANAATIRAYYNGASVAEAYVQLVQPEEPQPHLVINEVDYDQAATDTAEFVEIYNPGLSPVDLSNLSVMLVNGSDNIVYRTVGLASAGSLGAGEFLVIGPPGLIVDSSAKKIDITAAGTTPNSNMIQNGGPDGVALVDTSTTTLIDALSYEGSITEAQLTGFPGPVSLVEGTALSIAVADTNADGSSLCRSLNGQDTDDANSDWALCTTTPGVANVGGGGS